MYLADNQSIRVSMAKKITNYCVKQCILTYKFIKASKCYIIAKKNVVLKFRN